jgi:hypothetical protein
VNVALTFTRAVAAAQAEDVTSLTQQLQLLHVTKEFQQQVKAGSSSAGSGSGAKVAAVSTGDAAGATASANKEVTSLENLLKVTARAGYTVFQAACCACLAQLCSSGTCSSGIKPTPQHSKLQADRLQPCFHHQPDAGLRACVLDWPHWSAS